MKYIFPPILWNLKLKVVLQLEYHFHSKRVSIFSVVYANYFGEVESNEECNSSSCRLFINLLRELINN